PVVSASHARARDANDRSEHEVQTRDRERGDRETTDRVHRCASATTCGAPAPCIARQVSTSTAARASPGSTAHAISAARRSADVGWLPGTRAGEMTTECTIASWATTQHATATQKIA